MSFKKSSQPQPFQVKAPETGVFAAITQQIVDFLTEFRLSPAAIGKVPSQECSQRQM